MFSFQEKINSILKDVESDLKLSKFLEEFALTALWYVPVKKIIPLKQNETVNEQTYFNDEDGFFIDINLTPNGTKDPVDYAIQPASFGSSSEMFLNATLENAFQVYSKNTNEVLVEYNTKYNTSYTNIFDMLGEKYSHPCVAAFIKREKSRRVKAKVDENKNLYIHQIRITPFSKLDNDDIEVPMLGILYISNNKPNISENERRILIQAAQTIGNVLIFRIAYHLLFASTKKENIFDEKDKFFDQILTLNNHQIIFYKHRYIHRLGVFMPFFYPASYKGLVFDGVDNESIKQFPELLRINNIDDKKSVLAMHTKQLHKLLMAENYVNFNAYEITHLERAFLQFIEFHMAIHTKENEHGCSHLNFFENSHYVIINSPRLAEKSCKNSVATYCYLSALFDDISYNFSKGLAIGNMIGGNFSQHSQRTPDNDFFITISVMKMKSLK